MHFFKKIKKNTCRRHYHNLDDMIYSFWYIKQNILKLVILGHFVPFYLPKTPKNQNFEKWKLLLEISFYTVYQKSIISCTVLEIQSETNKIFCYFRLFFAFLPVHPNDPKNKKFFKKIKKISGDIIHFTYMCTINEFHMIYGSWNIRCDRQKDLPFCAIFCLFTPYSPRKSKF